MKTLFVLIALCLNLNYAQAQSATYYPLPQPLYGFGDTATYLEWYMLNYPKSNTVYWELLSDTLSPRGLKRGNIVVPQNIIDTWGTDDTVIPQWLIAQKVWAKKD